MLTECNRFTRGDETSSILDKEVPGATKVENMHERTIASDEQAHIKGQTRTLPKGKSMWHDWWQRIVLNFGTVRSVASRNSPTTDASGNCSFYQCKEAVDMNKTPQIHCFDSARSAYINTMAISNGPKATFGIKKNCNQEDDTNEFSIGQSLCEMAEAQVALGRWHDALHLWDEAAKVQVARNGKHHSSIGHILIRRGVTLSKLGLAYDAVLELEKGLRLLKAATQKETCSIGHLLDLAETYMILGFSQQAIGKNVDALESFNEAAFLKQNLVGKGRKSLADTFVVIGNAHHQGREYEEAFAAYHKALELYKEVDLPSRDPGVVRVVRCMKDRTMLEAISYNYWLDATM
eukprot:scaffold8419_cov62-Attheya_sp.AAC.14